MNNKEFISELSSQTGYTPKDTQKLVDTLINKMCDTFQEGNGIIVQGFGSFETKKKMERVMINPSTGQRMLVPPKLVLTFKPNQIWKEQVKESK